MTNLSFKNLNVEIKTTELDSIHWNYKCKRFVSKSKMSKLSLKELLKNLNE